MTTNNQAFASTATHDNDELSPKKQTYVNTLASKKMAYSAKEKTQAAVNELLAIGGDNPELFKIAQKLSQVSQQMQKVGSHLTVQQKAIEKANPEFQQEAMQYARSRQ